jgi:hypothetical protein
MVVIARSPLLETVVGTAVAEPIADFPATAENGWAVY